MRGVQVAESASYLAFRRYAERAEPRFAAATNSREARGPDAVLRNCANDPGESPARTGCAKRASI